MEAAMVRLSWFDSFFFGHLYELKFGTHMYLFLRGKVDRPLERLLTNHSQTLKKNIII